MNENVFIDYNYVNGKVRAVKPSLPLNHVDQYIIVECNSYLMYPETNTAMYSISINLLLVLLQKIRPNLLFKFYFVIFLSA